MKRLFFLMLAFAGLLLCSACEKNEVAPLKEPAGATESFVVPDIPPEIAELMTPADIAKFRAGPEEKYLQAVQARSLSGHANGPARWHPILMRFSYNLSFLPVFGTGCEPDCNPFTDNTCTYINECFTNPNWEGVFVGNAGLTEGYGKWLGSNIHAIYRPVFCAATGFSGYGEGYYEYEKAGVVNKLAFTGTQSVPDYDAEGNITFIWNADFLPGESTGIFEGAFGSQTAIIYTAYENSPFNPPYPFVTEPAEGYSEAVHYGWVFF